MSLRLLAWASADLLAASFTTLALIGECQGAGPRGCWITFLSHGSGGNVLYRMRPDDGEVTPIFVGELKDLPGTPDGLIYDRQSHFGLRSPDEEYFVDRAFRWSSFIWEASAVSRRVRSYGRQAAGGPVTCSASELTRRREGCNAA